MRISSTLALLLLLSWSSVAQWSTGSGTVYLTTTTDRVGFGTTSPGTKFHIVGSGTGSTVARIRVESSDNEAGISFASDGTNPVTIYSPDESNQLRFQTNSLDRVVIANGGEVGIGTTNPDAAYKLSVVGKIRATDVKVETGWSDFVFNDDYRLMPIGEVEKFIRENGRLPNIPSAEVVNTEGIYVGEMQSKLMQKIEELTLYVIDLKKQNDTLSERIRSLEKTVTH